MKRKGIALGVLFCILCTLFSGCGSRGGDLFSYPLGKEPKSIDPQAASSDAACLLAANCYEGLLRVNKDGELIPGVATGYTVSADKRTYTFTLREDTRWAIFSAHKELYGDDYKTAMDARVLARDFVFGMQRAVDPQTKASLAYLLFPIQNARAIYEGKLPVSSLGVEAVGDYTVKITLEYPDEDFLYALTQPPAMPCQRDFFERCRGKYGLEPAYALCNGPLHLSKRTRDTSIKLVRNNEYKGADEAYPASVTFFVNPDVDTVADKTAAGDYAAAFLTKAQFDAAESTKDLNVTPISDITYALCFNAGDDLFGNLSLRRALCLAAETSALPIPEGTKRAEGIVPPYCTVGTALYRDKAGAALPPARNESLAKEALNEALRVLDTDSISAELLCTKAHEALLKTLLQQWQRVLGVQFSVTLRTVEESELLRSVQNGTFEMAFCPLTATSVRASDFIAALQKDNPFGYTSPEFEKAAEALTRRTGDIAALTLACEKQLLEDAVILPVYHGDSYFVTHKDTRGIYFYSSPANVYFISAEKR